MFYRVATGSQALLTCALLVAAVGCPSSDADLSADGGLADSAPGSDAGRTEGDATMTSDAATGRDAGGTGGDAAATSDAASTDAGPAVDEYVCSATLAPGGELQSFVDGLEGGEIGCLEPGTHVVGTLAFRTTGVTLASVPGGRARVELEYAHIDAEATDVTLLRLDMVTTGQHTIRIFGDRALLERNLLSNSHAEGAGACVGVGGSNGVPDGVILRGNRFVECGGNGSNLNHAIYANAYRNLIIEDNVFYRTGAYNIQLYPDAIGTVVRHNVIDGSKEYSVRGGLVIDGTSESHIIEHNVFAYTATTAIQVRTGSGHAARSNCFWQNDGGDISGDIDAHDNLVADPGFRNRASGDLRLAEGSECLAAVGYDTVARLDGTW